MTNPHADAPLARISLEIGEMYYAGTLTKEAFLSRLAAAVDVAPSADALQGVIMYGETWAEEFFAAQAKGA